MVVNYLQKGIPFSKNYGPELRTLLNGIKQDSSSFAKKHGLDPVYLEAVMKGKEPLTFEIVSAVADNPPLDVRKLFDPRYRNLIPLQDDTLDGAAICTAEQRKTTERTFSRGPDNVPYYVYADTAMSRTSPFRPEWIKELYLHNGDTPEIPDWTFNKGHFEYQMTYFIGPVNFYWIDKEGNKHVRKMKTGDVNYITPFVPHCYQVARRSSEAGGKIVENYPFLAQHLDPTRLAFMGLVEDSMYIIGGNGSNNPNGEDSNPYHEFLTYYQMKHMGFDKLAEGMALHFVAPEILKVEHEKRRFRDISPPNKPNIQLDILTAVDALCTRDYLPDTHGTVEEALSYRISDLKERRKDNNHPIILGLSNGGEKRLFETVKRLDMLVKGGIPSEEVYNFYRISK